ncbi:hypothetical protein FQA39_LY02309 [Lamprigera yunnana]|nr:hypothetical protein FQA39_LY02309 [Lamprigera yunnana]
MCPGQRHLPLLFDKVVLTRNGQGATTSISMMLYVKKKVEKLTIAVTFWKCEDYEHADSCEYFLKDYTSEHICELMGQKKSSVDDFYGQF